MSREAAAAEIIPVAASRLGLLTVFFCGLTPAAMCCRRFATQNSATSNFVPWDCVTDRIFGHRLRRIFSGKCEDYSEIFSTGLRPPLCELSETSPKSENFHQVEESVMVVGYLKYCAAGCVGVVLVGGAMFGNELFSYLRTSTGAVRETVREAVPIEFELQRARDLIDDILPEIHANVRLIAEDEVEIAALENDLVRSSEQLVTDRRLLSQLRGKLDSQNVSYEIGNGNYSRKQLAEQAALKLARLKDAEMIQSSKQRLLENRQKSLQAAMQMLDRARNRKAELAQKVESLVAQHRLVKASTIGSRFHVDDSKLSKADQLLSDIQKRVDVSERVLAHDSISEITMEDVLDEDELLAEIDDHLGHGSTDDVEVGKLGDE
jgi:hypothetical protein